ncbi:MAG: branched-chain amino acid ABC transporter permease [Chloroflexota bacterium]|nr:MAG: branched-chain amino acid ABC transporter permease [Chloroflexota bacterium]
MEFNLVKLLPFLIDGLLIGFVYGIAAMGMTLIWGVMKVINLAHGAIISLGSFGVYLLFVSALQLHPYISILLVAAGGLVFGMLTYFIAIHRVINAPYLSTLLATFAVNMIIIGLGTAQFSTTPRAVDFTLGSFRVGGMTLLGTRLFAAGAAVAVTAALYLFLFRTNPGKYIRAVANNRAAAELMGIPSSRILALSFGLGTMLAAISGGLIATFFPFTILSGATYQLKSFVIGVLGGLGNPLGALLGGLILGALEGIIPAYMNTSWVPVVEFVMFVLILLLMPRGLLGAKK